MLRKRRVGRTLGVRMGGLGGGLGVAGLVLGGGLGVAGLVLGGGLGVAGLVLGATGSMDGAPADRRLPAVPPADLGP